MSFRPSSTAEPAWTRLASVCSTPIGPTDETRDDLWPEDHQAVERRVKRLVERLEHSRRDRLLPEAHRLCVLFLKLFERVCARLTAGLLRPIAADAALAEQKRHRLDRLYQRNLTDLDALWSAVGPRSAA
jgi:hypothetical protein